MSAFKHLFAIVAYGLFAAAAALWLPGVLDIGSGAAIAIGVAVFATAVALHEHLARAERDAAVAADLRNLYSVIDRLSDESGMLREEARTVRQGLMEATEHVGAREQNLEKVVSEVRVLQGLITQLSDVKVGAQVSERRVAGGGTSARIIPGPMPRAAAKPSAFGEVRADGPCAEILRTDVVKTGLNEDQVLDIVREGLKRDRVDLFLQPIVSLPQRKPRFYECFSRIRAEDGSMILPEQYIEVARRDGSLSAIDNMLLFRCIQLVRKAQRHKHNLGFFCNISVHTLVDRAFFREFIEFMADNRELASQLTFEFAQEDIAAHW